MDKEVYNKIKNEYDKKRALKIKEANKLEEEIFNKYPKIKQIKDEINITAIKSARLLLGEDEVSKEIEKENLSIKLQKLEQSLESELKKVGINKEDLEPKFDCKICLDTGFVKNVDNTRTICKCFEQKLINDTYNEANILKLNEENFNTFDTGYYSKNIDKEKYGIEKSPLDNIMSILEESKKFCLNINNNMQKNLLFTGNTGLGKTFIANAIAYDVINSGKSVIYQTAPILMDKIIEYKFNYDKNSNSKAEYLKILESDLLIIDDLGTETMSNVKFTELFNIINTRLLNNKKIVISTNLTLNELYNLYDERVMSRIIGNFNIYKFVGEDIRLKKRRIN